MSSARYQQRLASIEAAIASLRKLAVENPDSIMIKHAGREDITLRLVVGSYVAKEDNQHPFKVVNEHEVHITFLSDYQDGIDLQIEINPPLFHPNLAPDGKWRENRVSPIDSVYQLWDYYTFQSVYEEKDKVKNPVALRWYQRGGYLTPLPNKPLRSMRPLPPRTATRQPATSQTMATGGNAQEMLATNSRNEERRRTMSRPSSEGARAVEQAGIGASAPRSSGFRVKGTRTTRPSEWQFPQDAWHHSVKTRYRDWLYSVTRGSNSRDKRIKVVILESALYTMLQHARGDMYNERFGILIGGLFSDPQAHETWVEIVAMLPAERVRANSASVEVSNEEISRLNDNVDEILAETQEAVRKIGWYHTHPNHGIFMSGTDQTNQRLCYSADWQVAIVVDPIRKHYGAFHGAECNPVVDGLLVLPSEEARTLNTPAYRSWREIEAHLAAHRRPQIPPEPRVDRVVLRGGDSREPVHPPRQEVLPPHMPQSPLRKAANGVLWELGRAIYYPPFTILLILFLLLAIGCSLLLFSRNANSPTDAQHNAAQQLQAIQHSLSDAQWTLTNEQTKLQQSQQAQRDVFNLATDKKLDLKDNDPVMYRNMLLAVVEMDQTTDVGKRAMNLIQEELKYIVVKDDIFNGIAQKFGVKEYALRAANPGVQPDKIQVGQILTIPGVGSSSNAEKLQ